MKKMDALVKKLAAARALEALKKQLSGMKPDSKEHRAAMRAVKKKQDALSKKLQSVKTTSSRWLPAEDYRPHKSPNDSKFQKQVDRLRNDMKKIHKWHTGKQPKRQLAPHQKWPNPYAESEHMDVVSLSSQI